MAHLLFYLLAWIAPVSARTLAKAFGAVISVTDSDLHYEPAKLTFDVIIASELQEATPMALEK